MIRCLLISDGGSDVAEYAVATLDALSKGWVPPHCLSEDEYRAIKSSPEAYPKELVGFAAYSCSYGGKFWGGYARGCDFRGNPRDFASEQARGLIKQSPKLSGVKFTCQSYLDAEYPDGSTVYMDPPYAATTGYKAAFDHDEFWGFCDDLASRCRVFVSEYTAPDSWVSVWERKTSNSLTKNTGAKKGIEKLFVLRNSTTHKEGDLFA